MQFTISAKYAVYVEYTCYIFCILDTIIHLSQTNTKFALCIYSIIPSNLILAKLN